MRWRILPILCLFLAVAAPGFAGPLPLQTRIIHSPALQRQVRVNVLVPPAPAGDEHFPTLYVLHGAYGGPDDWPKAKDGAPFADIADKHRLLLVFPDGGEFGWYVDSPVDAASQYETHILKELIPAIEAEFPVLSQREARGIMGLSMGGHGAITLAAKHPEVFGSASSMSGILDLTAHPERWHIVARLGPFEENRAVWEANSAVQLAPRFRDAGVRLLVDCGTADVRDGATGAWEDSLAFHDRLTALGVPHLWRPLEGTHSWDYWTARVPEHVEFHQAAMADWTPGLDAGRLAAYRALDEKFRNAAEAAVTAAPAPE